MFDTRMRLIVGKRLFLGFLAWKRDFVYVPRYSQLSYISQQIDWELGWRTGFRAYEDAQGRGVKLGSFYMRYNIFHVSENLSYVLMC